MGSGPGSRGDDHRSRPVALAPAGVGRRWRSGNSAVEVTGRFLVGLAIFRLQPVDLALGLGSLSRTGVRSPGPAFGLAPLCADGRDRPWRVFRRAGRRVSPPPIAEG